MPTELGFPHDDPYQCHSGALQRAFLLLPKHLIQCVQSPPAEPRGCLTRHWVPYILRGIWWPNDRQTIQSKFPGLLPWLTPASLYCDCQSTRTLCHRVHLAFINHSHNSNRASTLYSSYNNTRNTYLLIDIFNSIALCFYLFRNNEILNSIDVSFGLFDRR